MNASVWQITLVTCDNQTMSGPVEQVLAAALFAAERHSQQRRKGPADLPYVNHLLEVAHMIAENSDPADTNLIVAALLHDVVEDTATSLAEVEQRFGSDVAGLVAEVTDDKSLPKATRKALQVQNAPRKSPRAQMIKLADKISNLRSILSSPPDWPYERKREYFAWARQVVDGLPAPNGRLKAEFDRVHGQFDACVKP
jgi:guanosine-3',5'-bis(diphosphate) 3'-pyrophosphohydrolase